MNKKGWFPGVLFIILLSVGFLNAQGTQTEKQPLFLILKSLESRFGVSFSYVDSTIENKVAISPDPDLDLETALEFLKLETGLEFDFLDNRFIVVKKAVKNRSFVRTQRLNEVIITNYLTSGISKLNNGSITIKPEKFGILPGLTEPDVLQTIQALPGVISSDETVSNINVRGGTHDQNLILWDGIKMYQSGHFFGLISAFNPFIANNIIMHKNGTPAKYGDGVSSIIDMKLPDEIDGEFQGGAGFNLINAVGYAKVPITENTELQVSSRRSLTDFLNTPPFEQYSKRIFQDSDFSNAQKNGNSISQNETFFFYDVTAKFLWDITEKDKLRVHFFNVFNDLNYDEQSTVNDRNEALNSKLTQRNSAIGLSYTRDWTEYLSTKAQAYVTNYDLDALNYDVLNNQRLIQENEIYDGAFKFDLNYNPNEQFEINAGYQFNEVGISNFEDVNNPRFRSYIKNVVRTHAVYGEFDYTSYDLQTKLIAGTRLNYISKFDMVLVEPRLTFSQRFLNYLRFEAQGEFKSQTTSQIIDLQNDFLGIENRRWVLANNNTEVVTINEKNIYPVPVIKSKQASAGLHFNKNGFLFGVEGFLKKVSGITTRSQGFQNQYQFENAIGDYQVTGVEALLNKQFGTLFSTWISYTYSKNDYSFESLNNSESFPNNVDIRHALTFAGTYTYENLKIALGLNWHSGIPNTQPAINDNPNDDVITYASPNSSNLKDYLRTDFSAWYKFKISDGVEGNFGASIWNLLNNKNIIKTYYVLDDNNTVNKVENESLGFTPNVSLLFKF
ncbi:TonB-dependent receptor plug domain-containing protein [Gaetbulibacter sp. M240]|uniref:TonB-dependent receptor plug domain-containing protein n=1 Tax=Gaetbulibacter sp. M240 TaxID=3126511 RepID=UPI00374F960B